MTIAPEPLKLIGSLEVPTTLAHFIENLRCQDWQTDGRSTLRHEYMELELEGDEFVLLQGQLDALEHLPILIEALRGACAHWQIDVFEEDGRLVKKLQA